MPARQLKTTTTTTTTTTREYAENVSGNLPLNACQDMPAIPKVLCLRSQLKCVRGALCLRLIRYGKADRTARRTVMKAWSQHFQPITVLNSSTVILITVR